jgi:hypothetical protein
MQSIPDAIVVLLSASSSGLGERLAGESARENINPLSISCAIVPLVPDIPRLLREIWSIVEGVFSKRPYVSENPTFWPVLLEDFLSEGFVVAEDVCNFSFWKNSFEGKGKPSNTGKEVNVCDFFMVHIFSSPCMMC